jgi:S-adenosylmethionine decarboxylase proenzyme
MAKHLIVELYGCDKDRANDIVFIENTMKEAANIAGAQVNNSLFYRFGEKGGIAGVILITEAYYGFRSWAESGYIGLDLISVGENVDNKKAFEFLVRKFGATKYSASELKRGNISGV